MVAATERRATGAISAWLAGLQAGMLGVFGMLLWLGFASEWHRRSFWAAENLMASAFWGAGAVRSGFGFRSISGLALYVLVYSLLGSLFALALRGRVTITRSLLLGIVFALAWYYLSFRLIYERVLPLVALLHVERQTVIGHLIYGIIIGRYPALLPKPPSSETTSEPQAAPPAPAETPESSTID